MKLKILAFAFCLSALFQISAVNNDLKTADLLTPVAVVELFSSQGCSSCPKADDLLSKTIASASKNKTNIFALSFHVDYWNYLGWKDPFSSKIFSDRQSDYVNKLKVRSSYTPQIIVNGRHEFVGSDENALEKSIKESLSLNAEAAFKNLNASVIETRKLKVSYELVGNFNNCRINFALIALSETTHIKSGENAGITLTNKNIVKQFISIKATEKGAIDFDTSFLPGADNGGVIVYIQDNDSYKIIGASQLRIK
jgi:hypothetical protein